MHSIYNLCIFYEYMKRRLLALLLLGCLGLSLCACGKNKENDKPGNEVQQDAADTEDDASSQGDESQALTPDISAEALAEEISLDNLCTISGCSWEEALIYMFGANYTLPFSYARISDSWTFDLTDYGHDETFMLQPGERTTATVELSNASTDYDMVVGFYNPYDVAISIEESQVWSVSFDFYNSIETTFPVLPKNITCGTQIVDIIIAYNTPSTPFSYNEETGAYDLHYQSGYDVYLTLEVDAELGLKKITLQSYADPFEE